MTVEQMLALLQKEEISQPEIDDWVNSYYKLLIDDKLRVLDTDAPGYKVILRGWR
jgi:hypothetical protein